MYAVLITAHAVAASTALAATMGGRRPRWFAVYESSMVAMLMLLVGAIAVDLDGRDSARHIVAVALVALGAVMVGHAELARRVRTEPSTRFVDHVGFTVVGLVDAFVIVALVNAGAPGAVAATVGAVIAVAGHLAIGAHVRSVRALGG